MLVCATIIAASFIRLGQWQLHRLAWRKGNNAQVEKYEKQPVKDYSEVFSKGHVIADSEQWQRVTVTGTYDQSKEIQALYRNYNQTDTQGSEAFTPFHTTKGDWILVDRGFAVKPDGGSEKAVLPKVPTGVVTVVGYVRHSEQGKADATTVQDGYVRLVNTDAAAKYTGLPLLNGYIGLISSTPKQSGSLTPMVTPEITEGPHLSYAIQWFSFTAIGIIGVIVLIRTDIQDRRKARRRAERRAAREAGMAQADAAGAGPLDGSPNAAASTSGATAQDEAVVTRGAPQPTATKPEPTVPEQAAPMPTTRAERKKQKQADQLARHRAALAAYRAQQAAEGAGTSPEEASQGQNGDDVR